MKRMCQKAIICALLVLAALCCAQMPVRAETGHAADDWQLTQGYQRITEPYGAGFILQGNAWLLRTGGHDYVFSEKMTQAQCIEFAARQEQLCAYLADRGVDTSSLAFYVLPGYPNRSDSDNHAAYLDCTAQQSWRQVFTVVQACLGDYTNYGYLYALSNHIAAQIGWACDETPAADEAVFADDPSLINLVYPCFSEKYNAPERIDACRALAVQLLEGVDDVFSQQAFLAQQEAFAQRHNAGSSLTYLQFAYNGESCPLKMRCNYLEVFWDSSFMANNEYLDGQIPRDYTQDVSGLIHTFTWFDQQAAQLCARLHVQPETRVPVQMSAAIPRGYASTYFKTGGLYYTQPKDRRIFATTVTVLAHEYTHHLFELLGGGEDSAYERWQDECMAYYFTLGEPYERRLNYINHVDASYRERLESTIGETYDEPSDYVKLMRILSRTEGKYQYHLKTSNALCSAFGAYFVSVYGEEAFVQTMLHPSAAEALVGQSLKQIIADWCADMENPEND